MNLFRNKSLIYSNLKFLSNGHYNLVRSLNETGVRVRFAPSPTGFVHLGGLRTSLFNYLYAKKHGGKFILRIEDTDQERIVPGSLENIIENLKWSNIVPDEGPTFGGQYGPYIQSERIDLYREMIEKLLKTNSVYRCFCTNKRIELLKREAAKNRETPKYDNRCRSLSKKEIEQYLAEKRPFTVRLKLKTGPITINDLIYGQVTHDLSQIEGDPIIFKSDHFPTYHFANVVDDYFMKISHVLRGVEWLISTPKHLMLYEAFGWQPPNYAHLPLLINTDGTKLSKRNNHIRISNFQEEKFYPETIVNYMTHLGGCFKLDTSECNKIYSMNELANAFELESINHNNCKIDGEKIKLLNKNYIENLLETDPNRLLNDLKILLEDFQDKSSEKLLFDGEYLQKVLKWSSIRIFTIKDLVSNEFLFLWYYPKPTWNIGDVKLPSDKIAICLQDVLNFVNNLDNSLFADKDELLKELKKFHQNNLSEISFSIFMKLMRFSLTNLKVGPPVAESMFLLGKDRTIEYLKKSIEYVNTFLIKN